MSKSSIDLATATRWASYVVDQLRPLCDRIEVAGSIRRRKPTIGDIEIVCIPSLADYSDFRQLVNGWPRVRGGADGKYTQRRVPGCPLAVDLFMVSAQTWACIYTIRTGSADFTRGLIGRAHDRGLQFQDGRLYCKATGHAVNLREEEDVFQALGMSFVGLECRECRA